MNLHAAPSTDISRANTPHNASDGCPNTRSKARQTPVPFRHYARGPAPWPFPPAYQAGWYYPPAYEVIETPRPPRRIR